jgi:hypothetical protein
VRVARLLLSDQAYTRAVEVEDRAARPTQSRARRIALKVVYWLAVLIISIGILIGLILFLESRDNSSVDGALAPAGPTSALST